MPFVANMNDEEQKSNQGTVPQGAIAPVGGGAVRLSPSSAVPAGGLSGGAGSAATPSTGGQFATLNQYLAANQGQAEPLANRITAGIGQQYKNLEGQNASLLGDIGNQVTANAIPNATETLTREAANPVSFASNPNDVASFKGLLNATYSGPTSAEGTSQYQAQQAAINNAIATGKSATQTEAGRENLLRQNEATPTSGVTALNSAILSESPTTLSSVEKAYDPFANLLTGLSSGAQNVNQNISKTRNDVSTANAAANKQIAEQTGNFSTGLSKQLSDAEAKANQYNQAVQAAQQSAAAYQPLKAALATFNPQLRLGIPNPFDTISAATAAPTPTMNTIATPDQLNLQQALAALGGNPGMLINPSAPVGGYTAPTAVPPQTVDLTALREAAARAAKQGATFSWSNLI